MEDFGFKLQNIKNRYWFKKLFRILLVILAVLIFVFILVKLINIISGDNSSEIENVPLIKSSLKEIKILPKDKGGLVVDNLDVKVYNVIDKNDDGKVNPIVKKSNQVIDIKNDSILNDQELLSQKINEINGNDKIEIQQGADENFSENKEDDNLSKEEETEKILRSNTNIKINSKSKESKTDINDLKQLGNDALINNIKNNKDVKPGIKVQLVALANRDSLIKHWNKLKQDHLNLFADKNYYIQKVNLNRVGTIYRLQVGMFSDNKSASDFCSEYIRVANKNKLDCIVVKN